MRPLPRLAVGEKSRRKSPIDFHVELAESASAGVRDIACSGLMALIFESQSLHNSNSRA